MNFGNMNPEQFAAYMSGIQGHPMESGNRTGVPRVDTNVDTGVYGNLAPSVTAHTFSGDVTLHPVSVVGTGSPDDPETDTSASTPTAEDSGRSHPRKVKTKEKWGNLNPTQFSNEDD